MLRIHNKTNTSCLWPKGNFPDYNNKDYFSFEKTRISDFDEYTYRSQPIKGCILEAEVIKNRGEKVTESDLNYAFANSLFAVMTTLEFNTETALNYFTALPPEFYTKESFAMVCEKMKSFEYRSPKFEQDRLEKNLGLFHDFAHKVNPEEIPAPTSQKNIDWLSRTK